MLTIDRETLEYTIDSADRLDTLNLEVLVRHTGGDEDEATELANELIEEDGVDILYGANSSDALRQVDNLVMGDHGIPFFVAQGSTANVTRDVRRNYLEILDNDPSVTVTVDEVVGIGFDDWDEPSKSAVATSSQRSG